MFTLQGPRRFTSSLRNTHQSIFRALAAQSMISLCILLSQTLAAVSKPYQLGPQDRIEIKIADLRTGASDNKAWSVFDGQFAVTSDGVVFLPLIGEVSASDRTLAELAQDISNKIQLKVGLTQAPSVAVQIVKYRSFYLLGDIENPGEFEFRPGMNVMQAVSVGGGFRRSAGNDYSIIQRDKISRRGELSTLAISQMELIAKQSRLLAEIEDSDRITWPKELVSGNISSAAQKAMQEETQLFNARRSEQRSQLDNLNNNRQVLAKEVAALADKEATLGRQRELINKDLQNVRDLMMKGLAISSRELAAEQSAAASDNNKLDLQVAKLRATQEIARIEREIITMQSKRKNESLRDIADVREKISTNKSKISTILTILKTINESDDYANSDERGGTAVKFIIYRSNQQKSDKIDADEFDDLMPGDTLRVQIQRKSLFGSSLASQSGEQSDNLSALAEESRDVK